MCFCTCTGLHDTRYGNAAVKIVDDIAMDERFRHHTNVATLLCENIGNSFFAHSDDYERLDDDDDDDINDDNGRGGGSGGAGNVKDTYDYGMAPRRRDSIGQLHELAETDKTALFHRKQDMLSRINKRINGFNDAQRSIMNDLKSS
jgi:hypothetical protein